MILQSAAVVFQVLTLLPLGTAAVTQLTDSEERRAKETCLKIFRLYGTSACHLCELAHDMLVAQQFMMGGFNVEELDISTCDGLFERYGVRIPVLQHPDERELGWPFSQSELRDFLAS